MMIFLLSLVVGLFVFLNNKTKLENNVFFSFVFFLSVAGMRRTSAQASHP